MFNSKKILVSGLKVVMGAALLFAFTGSSLTLADEDAPDFSQYKKLEKYEATGNKKACVRLRSIKSTVILDDQTILFKMRGKKSYVNKMHRKCSGLKRNDAFSYKVSGSQLCSVDMITILDTAIMQEWGSCGLGDFHEIIKLEKSASSGDNPTGK